MTDNPTSKGSSVSGGAGPQPAFSERPSGFDGARTVINPERRGLSGSDSPAPLSSGSAIWMRLFPHESAVEGSLPTGPAGCRLGHFLIEAMIGSGGMGAVFRAVDERLDRVVALKVLSPSLSRDASSVQRFENEARAAARLDHDNIARVYFVGEDQGLHFIAYEFVTGRNVRDLIRDRGPLDPREAVNYALQITTALRHTAAAGVVHRDIKPSNLIVTPRGRAKLVDLGLAKKVASESFGDLTIAGTTLGTFDYISPEQAKDPRNVDVRSDIYSLGCTLYHMLAGEPPYPEGTVLQKLLDHQGKDVPDARRKNPRVPPRLSAVVRRMMAPDPRDRYASPDELLLDLLPIAAEMKLRGINPEGLVWTSHPAETRSLIERNLSWIVAAAALLLIAFLSDRVVERMRGSRAAGYSEEAAVPDEKTPARPVIGAMKAASAPAGPSTPLTVAARSSEPPPSGSSSATPQNAAAKSAIVDTARKFLRLTIPSDPEKIFSDGGSSSGASSDEPSASSLAAGQGVEAKGSVTATGKGSDDTSKEKPVEAPPPEISIADNGVTTSYATLEAALTDAKDGSTIELKFNGSRPVSEKPCRISGKRITIKAGKGFRPVISFSPRELPATGIESRMIALSNGSIELVNVDIQAVVPESFASDHWSLFSLGTSDRLRWQGVNITLNNPGNRQAEVIDVASSREPMSAARQAGPMSSMSEFEVEVEHSFVRGNGTLFAIRTTAPGRADIRQSLFALQGPLVMNWGDDESPGESRRVAIRMEHLSGFLGGGLIQMDSGEIPRFLVPLEVTARNNIFAANSPVPLISLAGRTSGEDFARLIRWEGTRNFYDQFPSYWSVAASTAGPAVVLDFEKWKHLLGDTEIDANNGGIMWKRPSWRTKPSSVIRSSDFELAGLNQAVNGASDSADAGADLSAVSATAGAASSPE